MKKLVAIFSSMFVILDTESGETLEVTHSDVKAGKLAVGDEVALSGDKKRIMGIEERKTYLRRARYDRSRGIKSAKEHVLASNIDIVGIVASLKEPEFNSKLIDRYLIATRLGKAEPIIILNKTDLSTDYPEALKFYQDLGVKIFPISAKTGEGINKLKKYIKDKSVIFSGHSGVGKSTITSLFIDKALKTKTVSSYSKGRHTTSNSVMYQWDKTSYIIDTPGIKAFALWDIKKEELAYLFEEFVPYLESCKFVDCLHQEEPGCKVKNALAEGKISNQGYESYLELLEELAAS